jgi:hypothetical protein
MVRERGQRKREKGETVRVKESARERRGMVGKKAEKHREG